MNATEVTPNDDTLGTTEGVEAEEEEASKYYNNLRVGASGRRFLTRTC